MGRVLIEGREMERYAAANGIELLSANGRVVKIEIEDDEYAEFFHGRPAPPATPAKHPAPTAQDVAGVRALGEHLERQKQLAAPPKPKGLVSVIRVRGEQSAPASKPAERNPERPPVPAGLPVDPDDFDDSGRGLQRLIRVVD